MTDETPTRKLLTKEGELPTGNYPKEKLVVYLRADRVHAMIAAEKEKALRVKLQEAANKAEAKCKLRQQYDLGQAVRDTILALIEEKEPGHE